LKFGVQDSVSIVSQGSVEEEKEQKCSFICREEITDSEVLGCTTGIDTVQRSCKEKQKAEALQKLLRLSLPHC